MKFFEIFKRLDWNVVAVTTLSLIVYVAIQVALRFSFGVVFHALHWSKNLGFFIGAVIASVSPLLLLYRAIIWRWLWMPLPCKLRKHRWMGWPMVDQGERLCLACQKHEQDVYALLRADPLSVLLDYKFQHPKWIDIDNMHRTMGADIEQATRMMANANKHLKHLAGHRHK